LSHPDEYQRFLAGVCVVMSIAVLAGSATAQTAVTKADADLSEQQPIRTSIRRPGLYPNGGVEPDHRRSPTRIRRLEIEPWIES
jgi:hypothetical protein